MFRMPTDIFLSLFISIVTIKTNTIFYVHFFVTTLVVFIFNRNRLYFFHSSAPPSIKYPRRFIRIYFLFRPRLRYLLALRSFDVLGCLF